jgi:hypothetical protein
MESGTGETFTIFSVGKYCSDGITVGADFMWLGGNCEGAGIVLIPLES